MDNKLEKLKKLLSIVNEDTVSKKDIELFIVNVLGYIKESKKEVITLSEDVTHNINSSINYFNNELEKLNSDIKTAKETLNTDFEQISRSKIEDIDKIIKKLESIKVENGKDYILTQKDKEEIAGFISVPVVEKRVEVIENTLSPEDVVGLINRSPTDDDSNKIDASHIKNLPIKGNASTGVRLLKRLADVDVDGATNGQTLVYDSTTQKWIPGSSSGASFGTAGQMPFTNATGDDFEYDDEVTFSKTDRRLELKGQGGTKGLLGFDVQDDTKTRVFEAENTTLNLMTGFHIAQDFSSGVSDQDSYSWGMDRTGLAFYHGNDESSWGYYLYESSDGYVYNPSYYQDFNENLDFGGEISAKHLLGRSDSTPTAVAGTGAGTSPTISVEGTDTAMRVVVTAGTTPAANATVATITFDQPFTNRPIVVASAGNVTAAARAAVMHFDAANGNELTIKVGATALTAAAGYVWNIHVIGRK